MRRFAIGFLAAVAPACLLAGCGTGESPPALPATQGPHGGHVFPFPENRGSVEIRTDRDASAHGSRGPAAKARILAYFYQADGTTAMTPAPTDVKVRLGVDDASPAVPLAPDRKESGLFASEPGAYPEGLRGQIEARVNGEPVKVPFLYR